MSLVIMMSLFFWLRVCVSEYPLYKKNNRNQMGPANNSKPRNLDMVCDICYEKLQPKLNTNILTMVILPCHWTVLSRDPIPRLREEFLSPDLSPLVSLSVHTTLKQINTVNTIQTVIGPVSATNFSGIASTSSHKLAYCLKTKCQTWIKMSILL